MSNTFHKRADEFRNALHGQLNIFESSGFQLRKASFELSGEDSDGAPMIVEVTMDYQDVDNSLDTNELNPLKTAEGITVGYLFPEHEETVESIIKKSEMDIALAMSRPGVGEFVKSVSDQFAIHVTDLVPMNGEMHFTGITDDGVTPEKNITGIIEDVW